MPEIYNKEEIKQHVFDRLSRLKGAHPAAIRLNTNKLLSENKLKELQAIQSTLKDNYIFDYLLPSYLASKDYSEAFPSGIYLRGLIEPFTNPEDTLNKFGISSPFASKEYRESIEFLRPELQRIRDAVPDVLYSSELRDQIVADALESTKKTEPQEEPKKEEKHVSFASGFEPAVKDIMNQARQEYAARSTPLASTPTTAPAPPAPTTAPVARSTPFESAASRLREHLGVRSAAPAPAPPTVPTARSIRTPIRSALERSILSSPEMSRDYQSFLNEEAERSGLPVEQFRELMLDTPDAAKSFFKKFFIKEKFEFPMNALEKKETEGESYVNKLRKIHEQEKLERGNLAAQARSQNVPTHSLHERNIANQDIIRNSHAQMREATADEARNAGLETLEQELPRTAEHQKQQTREEVERLSQQERLRHEIAQNLERGKEADSAARQLNQGNEYSANEMAQIDPNSLQGRQLLNPFESGIGEENPAQAEAIRNRHIEEDARSNATSFRDRMEDYTRNPQDIDRATKPENVSNLAFLRDMSAVDLLRQLQEGVPLEMFTQAFPKANELKSAQAKTRDYIEAATKLNRPSEMKSQLKNIDLEQKDIQSGLHNILTGKGALEHSQPLIERGTSEITPSSINEALDSTYQNYMNDIRNEALEQFREQKEIRERDFNRQLERNYSGMNWWGGGRKQAEKEFREDELKRERDLATHLGRMQNDLRFRFRNEEMQREALNRKAALEGAAQTAHGYTSGAASRVGASQAMQSNINSQREFMDKGLANLNAMGQAKAAEEAAKKNAHRIAAQTAYNERKEARNVGLGIPPAPMLPTPYPANLTVAQPMINANTLQQGVQSSANAMPVTNDPLNMMRNIFSVGGKY